MKNMACHNNTVRHCSKSGKNTTKFITKKVRKTIFFQTYEKVKILDVFIDPVIFSSYDKSVSNCLKF